MLNKISAIVILAAVVIFACQDASTEQSGQDTAMPDQLSEWQFFVGPLADLKPAEGVFGYSLNSTLFSDYSEKARFIKLPTGTKMTFEHEDKAIFPSGSIIIKNFFYYDDAREPEAGKRIIETRLLVKKEDDWDVATYIWNEAQDEAHLEILGGKTDVHWTNGSGQAMQVHYEIPDNNDCKSCHLQSGEVKPIGPRLPNLNLTLATGENQLDFFVRKGLLAASTQPWTPQMVDYNDEKAPLHDRALAYLDINCGHCHSEVGPASNTGLFLHYNQDDPFRLGLLKTPVSAAQGSGGFDYNVVPGDPDQSILLYRMKNIDPGIAMPEVGRTIPHLEGISLIETWIKSLPSDS